MRLQKYLANNGIDSRRKCEEYILQGRVKVNNTLIKELGYKIDPIMDKVYFDNKLIKNDINKIYIMINKPKGYITSVKDPQGRKTVLDLIKINERVYPVGRLDYDTEGLLLLTNDGKITYEITHPKHNIEKKYLATIKGIPTEEQLQMFRNGIRIDNYTTSKASITILNIFKSNAYVEIVIHEGKNRQIRKMCEKIGHPVINLKRVAIGDINLNNLKSGGWKYLTTKEIKILNKMGRKN